MNIFLTAILVAAQFFLPRRIGFVPLVIALFHLGNFPILSEFTPVRLVVLCGLGRAVAGGFFRWSPRDRLDQLMVLFAVVAMLSTFGHEGNQYVPSPFIERAGLVLNVLGSYLYGRAYFSETTSLVPFARVLAIVLIPFSALMAMEQASGRNFYAALGLGARSELAGVREGRFRAKGPFGHAILAGTAAAVSFPFMVLLRRRHPRLAMAGMAASVVGAGASASSGPLAALIAASALLVFWRWRRFLPKAKIFLLLTLIVLNFTMSRPIWFLISRIDIVGGSTGWHRSKLIDTAMKDIGSWWLAGTDYTRHWMHSGVTWNPNHTDITNYYLQFGVWGGLPLMLTFIVIIFKSLGGLEKSMLKLRSLSDRREFEVWCVWTAIITHAVSFLSIAYFDQSYAGFFPLIGMTSAIAAWVPARSRAPFMEAGEVVPGKMKQHKVV